MDFPRLCFWALCFSNFTQKNPNTCSACLATRMGISNSVTQLLHGKSHDTTVLPFFPHSPHLWKAHSSTEIISRNGFNGCIYIHWRGRDNKRVIRYTMGNIHQKNVLASSACLVCLGLGTANVLGKQLVLTHSFWCAILISHCVPVYSFLIPSSPISLLCEKERRKKKPVRPRRDCLFSELSHCKKGKRRKSRWGTRYVRKQYNEKHVTEREWKGHKCVSWLQRWAFLHPYSCKWPLHEAFDKQGLPVFHIFNHFPYGHRWLGISWDASGLLQERQDSILVSQLACFLC